MTEFENKLILASGPYQGGFFPPIPDYKKEGSAFLLTKGEKADLVVDEKTTQRDIRKGKYTWIVEIFTKPYLKEVTVTSPSKDTAYSFSVYVKAVIQVIDFITFYNNRNLDVDAYFQNLFALDVRKITRKYSILDFEGMDDELNEKLSKYQNEDTDTGFSYRVSIVDAEPGGEAKEYVKKYGTQRLDAQLKEHARGLTGSLSNSLVEALKTEVVEGKLTELEAYAKIEEYRNRHSDTEYDRIKAMRDDGFLTDEEARTYMKQRAMPEVSGETKLFEKTSEEAGKAQDAPDGNVIDAMYEEDEEV